ncbi:MAG: AAA family ATPase, partial [Rhizonema sp. PD37]|nr:AAA family ATPase [Rhizonema sp. PD37]
MTDIAVKFVSDFKSFRLDDAFQFKGNLIAFTGENGSGKSQLLSSMARQYVTPNSYGLSTDITKINIGIQSISKDDILYCNFKTIGQPSLSGTNYSIFENNKTSLFHLFNNNNLNEENRLIYNKIHQNLRDRLGDNYKTIVTNQDTFFKYLPSNYFNDTKNIFITDLNARFYQYAREVRNFKARQYSSRNLPPENVNEKDFFEENLGKAPWTFFNELFEKIGFEYRFDENYELNDRDAINNICLKHVNDNQISVQVTELSDGEISLFSLFVAFLRTKYDGYKIKLLLLDEYDAPFNPLLIKQYIIMLGNYFVAEGIKVILSSHSPNTIALLPNGTSIYWFKKLSQVKNDSRYQEITKAEALSKLAEGIPYYKVDIENKKVSFCEEENDRLYYERAFKALKDNKILNTDGTITFVGVHKVHKSELNSQNGGCLKVKENTELLRKQGISKITGIIDWDLKEQNDLTNAIFIHGGQNRYSLENYLLEPIFLSKILIDYAIIKPEEISPELTLGRFNQLTEVNEEYQNFC